MTIDFMKKLLVFVLMLSAMAAQIDLRALSRCKDMTLRADYIFSGTDKTAEISLSQLYVSDGWYGRAHNPDTLILKGNGQISMRDEKDGQVLYKMSFSTLFQEWQATEEAVSARRSFENVFLLPMPQERAVVRVELYGFKGDTTTVFEHLVDPSDILIRHGAISDAPVRMLLESGSPKECIDIAIVAEGYTAEELDIFWEDARMAMDEILSYEPFASKKDRFNFIAVAPVSKESGVSIPNEGLWIETALGAHFSTFYSDRYLTTLNLRKLHDALSGLPYEHIIILANTSHYGGGGIYNSYTLTTTHNEYFKPVVVHEFGHSFAGLGDEYYYDDQYVELYYSGTEPWEQNITTLADFPSKWESMLPERTAKVADDSDLWKKIAEGADPASFIGVYEGGGYQSKGVYRPYPDCRMKTNVAPVFCPVCQDAIRRLIDFY